MDLWPKYYHGPRQSITVLQRNRLRLSRAGVFLSRHRTVAGAILAAQQDADDRDTEGTYRIRVDGGLLMEFEIVPRADVTIRFSTNAPAFAYPPGAGMAAEASAPSAFQDSNDVEATINGVAVSGNSGSVAVGEFALLTIPDITVGVGSTHDMSQYILDPQGELISTSIINLNAAYATYDDTTLLLTGVQETPAPLTNVQYEVTYSSLSASGVTGAIDDGETVTIAAEGVEDFGATGPTLVYYDDYSGVADGGTASTTPILGRGTVTAGGNGMPIVNDVTGMPYGKGIAIGAETSAAVNASATDYRLLGVVDTAPTAQYFHFYVWQYPSSNQTAAATYLDNTVAWQVKSMWHFFSDDGFASAATSDNDLYEAHAWFQSGEYWKQDGRLTSNKTGGPSTANNGDSGFSFDANQNTCRTESVFRSYWIKPSATGADPTGSDGHIFVTGATNGALVDVDFSGALTANAPSATQNTFDRFTMPGYVEGFNRPESANPYAGQIYVTAGSGCAARVEITDNATYTLSSERTICTASSWSSSSITATIRRGVFSDLSNKYIHVFDQNNDLIASRLIS